MVGDNIKELRQKLGKTQQEFADRLGVKQNTIALIESGKRNISEQLLLSISREFGANLEWLRTGEGEMYVQKNQSLLEQLEDEFKRSPKSRELIESYLKLPPHVRDMVAVAIEQAAKFYPRKPDDELSKEEVLEMISVEFDDAQAAKKRGTATSSVSTGTSGTSKKFGNSP